MGVGGSRCQFTEWSAQLNEIAQGQRTHLIPTDARLRPDVRALEHGRYKEVCVASVNLLPVTLLPLHYWHWGTLTFTQVIPVQYGLNRCMSPGEVGMQG